VREDHGLGKKVKERETQETTRECKLLSSTIRKALSFLSMVGCIKNKDRGEKINMAKMRGNGWLFAGRRRPPKMGGSEST